MIKKLLITLFVTCTVLIVVHPGQSAKIPIETDPFGYPIQTVSPAELRRLLTTRQYQKLNQVLQDYQNEMAKDIRQEYKVYEAYEALALSDPVYERLLGDWVQATPKAYQPYLARANYYYNMGWESRGYAWAKDTTGEQFQRMEDYFARTLTDLEFVLKSYPRSMVTYDILIGLNMAISEREGMEWACRKALEIYPYSFLIRADYIHALKPRWGGSYRAMEAFALEAQKYAPANPRLVLLKGYVPADQADLAIDDDDYAKAIGLYQQALKQGEFWDWHYGMAIAYFNWKKPSEAMAEIDKAVSLRPNSAKALTYRAHIHYKQGATDKALADIEAAREVASQKSEYRNNANWMAHQVLLKGYDHYKAKDYDQAIAQYDLAVRFDPEYGELYYWRAQAYVGLKDLGRARMELDTAIRLEPTYLDSYLLMDWLLMQDKRWDEIIAYWTRLIELQPENARAYLERGGAYYHKGDMQAALRDAKKACDLGNSEGCRMYEMLRERSG